MVKLEKLNKYYNLGKPNQIHVIDETSMELPSSGIVCLLGPSGCGKTTLLNAIGGLDKVDSGLIYIDDDEIARAPSNRLDDIRNAKIGYIFQNFYLLDDKTVFENVAIALRLVGITDESIISDRVHYCLRELGIYRYRNKPAAALSGGQRQRVAIARAIVKNPKLIIADEPTGNLDSTNTIEIMNIIKSISEDRLVILVTHERKLAEFYADYIAEMKDGKIVEAYENDSSEFLDYQQENKIYLKDFPVHRNVKPGKLKLSIYSENDREGEIKLIIKGNNIYIDTNDSFNIVSEDSNVQLVDEHFKAIDRSVIEDTEFDYAAFLPENHKAEYTSQYKFSNMIKDGLNSLRSYKKLKKFLLLGFVLAATFCYIAVSNVMGVADVEPKDYATTSPNYVEIYNSYADDSLLKLIESLDSVDYVLPGDTKKSVELPMDDYLQTANAKTTLAVSIGLSAYVDKDTLVCGRLPRGKNEVLLDRMIIDDFLRKDLGRDVGINSVKQFLGREIDIPNMQSLVITGVVDTQGPSLFVSEDIVTSVLVNATDQKLDGKALESSSTDLDYQAANSQVQDIGLCEEELVLVDGSLPRNLNEVIVSSTSSQGYKLGDKIKPTMNGKKLKVVGVYQGKSAMDDTIYCKEATLRKDYISKNESFTAHTDNPALLVETLKKKEIAAQVNADADRQEYIKNMRNSLISSIIVAAIILMISLIEMFLMLRSSFLSRIKEIGILRAIGFKKGDIYKMFIGEILAISICTSIIGIALGFVILKYVTVVSYFLMDTYTVSFTAAIICFAIIMIFNLVVGVLPVANTLRKTPAQILSRTDI